MNSIEALENIAITFDEGGYEPTTLGAKSGHFIEVFGDDFNTIKQELERLKKLEEEYNNLKKGIKIFLEYYDVYLFDEDGLGSCEIGVATIGEDFYISKEKYLLLKEVFENES